MNPLTDSDPWQQLKLFTPARIALGRSGQSLPTAPWLDFGLAHAQARDAVHDVLDAAALRGQFAAAGLDSIEVRSQAKDRSEYLRRPDAGRCLDALSIERLRNHGRIQSPSVLFVVADGLSARAAERHAPPLLRTLCPLLPAAIQAPIVVAQQSRVALGDQIGELLGAELLVMLIGERPGLSSPDGLSVYVTYAPRIGRTDAERNCISNIRPAGLTYERAARGLESLLSAARRLGRSGIALMQHSGAADLVAPRR